MPHGARISVGWDWKLTQGDSSWVYAQNYGWLAGRGKELSKEGGGGYTISLVYMIEHLFVRSFGHWPKSVKYFI